MRLLETKGNIGYDKTPTVTNQQHAGLAQLGYVINSNP